MRSGSWHGTKLARSLIALLLACHRRAPPADRRRSGGGARGRELIAYSEFDGITAIPNSHPPRVECVDGDPCDQDMARLHVPAPGFAELANGLDLTKSSFGPSFVPVAVVTNTNPNTDGSIVPGAEAGGPARAAAARRLVRLGSASGERGVLGPELTDRGHRVRRDHAEHAGRGHAFGGLQLHPAAGLSGVAAGGVRPEFASAKEKP